MKNVFGSILSVPKRLTLVLVAALLVTSTGTGFFADVLAEQQRVSIEGSVQVANVTAGDTGYTDSVSANVDEVVKVQIWYHNREDFDSERIAKDLSVALDIPEQQGKSQTITGTIKGSNTNTVTDSANVNLSLDNAYLDYIEGSAKWRYNKGAKDGRTVCQTGEVAVPTNDPNNCYVTEGINDSIVTGTAGIELEDAQPCFAYEATVTVLLKVKASEVKVNKYVSEHDGDTNVSNNDWKVKNSALPGEKLDYMIRFENKGNTVLRDVAVGDNLPDYMKYVAGSTRITNGNNPSGVAAGTDNVWQGGINTGDYKPGAVGYVTFTVKIDDKNVYEKCGVYTLKNVGVVRPAGMNEFYNTASTDVRVECKEEQPEKPTYKCIDLKVVEKDAKYSYSFEAVTRTSGGAVAHEVKYDFGDDQTATVDYGVAVDHTYAAPGTYNITAQVSYKVDGKTVVVEPNQACTAQVTIPETPTTPETPVTPENPEVPSEIPATGPAAIFGGLFGSSALGYGIYSWLASRRVLRGSLNQ